MIVGWDAHLKNGNIYRVEIQLPMKDDQGGEDGGRGEGRGVRAHVESRGNRRDHLRHVEQPPLHGRGPARGGICAVPEPGRAGGS